VFRRAALLAALGPLSPLLITAEGDPTSRIASLLPVPVGHGVSTTECPVSKTLSGQAVATIGIQPLPTWHPHRQPA